MDRNETDLVRAEHGASVDSSRCKSARADLIAEGEADDTVRTLYKLRRAQLTHKVSPLMY